MTTEAEIAEAVASDPDIEIGDRLIAPGLFQQAPDLAPGRVHPLPARGAGPQAAGLRRTRASTGSACTCSAPTTPAASRAPTAGPAPSCRWCPSGPRPAWRSACRSAATSSAPPTAPWSTTGCGPRSCATAGMERSRAFAASALPDEDDVATPVPADARRRGPGTPRGPARGTGPDRPGRRDRGPAATDRRGGRRPAGGWPLTWLVDGAVLDAADALSAGNPAIDLASDGSNEVTAPDDEPTEEETAARVGRGRPRRQGRDPLAGPLRGRRRAHQRPGPALRRPRRERRGRRAPRAPRPSRSRSTRARAVLSRAGRLLRTRGGAGHRATSPPRRSAVLDPDLRVLLGEPALPERPDRRPTTRRCSPPRGAAAWPPRRPPRASGVPGRDRPTRRSPSGSGCWPRPPSTPCRTEAADPLVTVLPALWDPGRGWERAEFFDALEQQPWLDGISLSSVVDPAAVGSTTVRGEDVVYPDEEAEAEVPAYAVAASAELRRPQPHPDRPADRRRRHRRAARPAGAADLLGVEPRVPRRGHRSAPATPSRGWTAG